MQMYNRVEIQNIKYELPAHVVSFCMYASIVSMLAKHHRCSTIFCVCVFYFAFWLRFISIVRLI